MPSHCQRSDVEAELSRAKARQKWHKQASPRSSVRRRHAAGWEGVYRTLGMYRRLRRGYEEYEPPADSPCPNNPPGLTILGGFERRKSEPCDHFAQLRQSSDPPAHPRGIISSQVKSSLLEPRCARGDFPFS